LPTAKHTNNVRITDLMTSDLTFCTETTTIRDPAQSNATGRLRHLPIVDDSSLVGILDIGDLSRPSLQLANPAPLQPAARSPRHASAWQQLPDRGSCATHRPA
jgi:CBS-domain-containing membrane protein